LPNSRFPLNVEGATSEVHFALVGPGRMDGDTYVAPGALATPAAATIVAAARGASGNVEIALAPWPHERDVFAVASYDDGIALHRAADGALLGVLALDGGVADVAQLGDAIVAPSTTEATLWTVDLRTGVPVAVADVPTGNEVAGFRGDAYVTNRDIDGDGALTRVHAGSVRRIRTGATAEGLAIDTARAIAYVANVNDPSIAEVDLTALQLVRRLPAPERAFSVALDAPGGRLYVVSNVPRSAAHPGGTVETVELASARIGAHSAPFRFPLGIVLDAPARRLFVTDEADGTVAVLDAGTLRPLRRPLRACAIAWRPAIDRALGRLYVPCAGKSVLAAFDLRTLRPLPGSPFPTGGYPLAVSFLRRPLSAVNQTPGDDGQAEEQAQQAEDR
jgi:DNA-binding beta-propeller fold protein YncE